VNLPAHLVVIKSTLQYSSQGYIEYSPLDVLQMMGRADRPQYDQFGVAVILTDDQHRETYENICNGQLPIESK